MPHSIILDRIRNTIGDAPTKRLAVLESIVDDITRDAPSPTVRTIRALRKAVSSLAVAGADIKFVSFSAKVQQIAERINLLDPRQKEYAERREKKLQARKLAEAEALKAIVVTPGAAQPAVIPADSAPVDPWDAICPPQEFMRLFTLQKKFGSIPNEQLLIEALNGRERSRTNLIKLFKVLKQPQFPAGLLISLVECYLA
jgi:hypothetical protein